MLDEPQEALGVAVQAVLFGAGENRTLPKLQGRVDQRFQGKVSARHMNGRRPVVAQVCVDAARRTRTFLKAAVLCR